MSIQKTKKSSIEEQTKNQILHNLFEQYYKIANKHLISVKIYVLDLPQIWVQTWVGRSGRSQTWA